MGFATCLNDRFLRACLGQATDATPVWLMRQAGRYLPEYLELRAQAGSFMGLATNVDLATEVTLQPLRRFPLDAAILFSDILTIPDAMGLGLSFVTGEGPQFAHPLRDESAVQGLQVPDMERLRYVFDVVTSVRRALEGQVPLIGFAGSPWTLACYMVEGGPSTLYAHVKRMLYTRPELLRHLLTINADSVALYLNRQIDAGAQAVMVFDSWGGVLGHQAFEEFSLAYTRRVLQQLRRHGVDGEVVPRIVFTKGGAAWLPEMTDLPCDVLGLDWTVSLKRAREHIGRAQGQAVGGRPDNVSVCALQGNLDPVILLTSADAVRQGVRAVLDDFGTPAAAGGVVPGHVFNLGHGVNKETPPEHVAALVEEVHSYSRRLRQDAAA